MNTQTHTYTHVRANTRGATDKVQCLLPSSFSHKPGIGDLLVGPPGYTLHASDTLPLPQLHNWETGALQSKADSLKDTCKHRHTSKDTLLLTKSGTVMFSPLPK